MARTLSPESMVGLGLSRDDAARLLRIVDDATTPQEAWSRLRTTGLTPAMPFAVHQRLFEHVTGSDLAAAPPTASWTPSARDIEGTNISALMREQGLGDYVSLHQWSAEHREDFWAAMVRRLGIQFRIRPQAIRAPGSPAHRPEWFPGARLNIAESCFRAPGGRAAILYADESDPTPRATNYKDLARLVDRFAYGLDDLGLAEDAAVALYMPMTVESVAAYFGIVKSGRVVVGIADASAPQDLANKIRISRAQAVVTVDSYVRGGKAIPIHPKVVESKAPLAIVVGDGKLRPQDRRWDDVLGPDRPFQARVRAPSDPTNILFSSGTTKDPKAIPWTHTTPLKAAADAHLHHDVHAEDVLAWPTSFGWMMGPWLAYAALMHGATMALYNGDPRTRPFGQFVQDSKATLLGVVPKLVREWRESGRMDGLDWSRVRRFSSTGETSNPEDMLWLMSRVPGYAPVIEYCGGTEIGGGYITSTLVQPNAPALFSTPALGLDFVLLDENGRTADRGEVGIVPPSIGLSNDLLNYDHFEEYFAGFAKGPEGTTLRRHGDQLERRGPYWRHLGRIKDMINIFGVKTSSEEIRNVLKHERVQDTKPVAIDVEGKGQHRLVVYTVPKSEGKAPSAEELRKEFNRLIKERLNPLLAHVDDVVLVQELPQAGPGKTLTSEWFKADYRARLAAVKR